MPSAFASIAAQPSLALSENKHVLLQYGDMLLHRHVQNNFRAKNGTGITGHEAAMHQQTLMAAPASEMILQVPPNC